MDNHFHVLAQLHDARQLSALVATNAYYLELGKRAATRQRRWREFLFGEDDKAESINVDAPALGSKSFRRRTQQYHDRARSRGAGRRRHIAGEEGG